MIAAFHPLAALAPQPQFVCQGSSLPGWAATAGIVIAAIGTILAILQLNRILHSLSLSRQANTIGTVSHCATRYHKLMSEGETAAVEGTVAPGSWWYHYWDLFTEEFMFFEKGFLDPDIFEMWIGELATLYQQAPWPHTETRAAAHALYLKTTLPAHSTLFSFFQELGRASLLEDPLARANAIHALVVSYAPRNGMLSLGFRPAQAAYVSK